MNGKIHDLLNAEGGSRVAHEKIFKSNFPLEEK